MSRRRIEGASYTEVLVATALLAIAIVPAVDSLRVGVVGSGVSRSQTVLHYRVAGRMEELLAEPFAELDAEAVALASPSTASNLYSDAAGTTDRRLVYLSRYDADDVDPADGDPFTGMDEGLLWIRVEVEASEIALERLRVDGE